MKNDFIELGKAMVILFITSFLATLILGSGANSPIITIIKAILGILVFKQLKIELFKQNYWKSYIIAWIASIIFFLILIVIGISISGSIQ